MIILYKWTWTLTFKKQIKFEYIKKQYQLQITLIESSKKIFNPNVSLQ